jgi:hypothetical protein
MDADKLADDIGKQHDLDNYDYTVPHVSSYLDNWEPKPMLSLKEFCFGIDKDRPNFIAEAKEDGKIDAKKLDLKDLTEEDWEIIREREEDYKDPSYNTFDSVATTINKSLKWRSCYLVDVD